jgi:4'-phosphopantetheinyl transferase
VLEVVILKAISDLTQAEYAFLFSLVSLERQVRIERFCFFRDVQNSLLGDILARVEICRMTGFSNRQLEFAVNSSGKPFLVNNSCVHYNISHAGHYVVCVIGDVPVGVDIELIKPVDVTIVERFFMPDEQTYILSAQGDIRNKRFFEVWTKKESRIKWEGKGLFGSLSSFNVLNSLEQQEIFYHCIYNDEDLIGYICSNKAETPLIRLIDTPMLLQYAQCLLK